MRKPFSVELFKIFQHVNDEQLHHNFKIKAVEQASIKLASLAEQQLHCQDHLDLNVMLVDNVMRCTVSVFDKT